MVKVAWNRWKKENFLNSSRTLQMLKSGQTLFVSALKRSFRQTYQSFVSLKMNKLTLKKKKNYEQTRISFSLLLKDLISSKNSLASKKTGWLTNGDQKRSNKGHHFLLFYFHLSLFLLDEKLWNKKAGWGETSWGTLLLQDNVVLYGWNRVTVLYLKNRPEVKWKRVGCCGWEPGHPQWENA